MNTKTLKEVDTGNGNSNSNCNSSNSNCGKEKQYVQKILHQITLFMARSMTVGIYKLIKAVFPNDT